MKNKERVPWLDCIRFFAAFFVVMSHCRCNFFTIYKDLNNSSQNILTKAFFFLSTYSDEAVLVFFIMSGFLVAGQSFNKMIKQPSSISFKHFAISRICRIMFPLGIALLYGFIVNSVTGRENSIIIFIGNLFSLQGLFVGCAEAAYWTMPYIVWSYVLVYGLLLFYGKETRQTILGAMLVTTSLCVLIALPRHSAIFVIMIGALIVNLRNKSIPKWAVILALIIFLITSVITKISAPSQSRAVLFHTNVFVTNIIEGMCLVIIISQIIRSKPINKKLQKIEQGFTPLSAFSYTLYLTHNFSINFLLWIGVPRSKNVDFLSICTYFGCVIICTIVAYLIYLLAEKHTYKITKLLMCLR